MFQLQRGRGRGQCSLAHMSPLLITWSWATFIVVAVSYQIHPTVNIVRAAGFPIEEHRIVTDDGYWIVLHRLPPVVTTARPRVVMYVHGLFGGSLDVTIRGRDTGLAFQMSEAGFDVWLPNLRGSTYEPVTVGASRNNTWDFSFDENAQYDFPAVMDYVLAITRAEKVSTIGLSMGANVILGAVASHPEYDRRISAMVFFAPTVQLKHITSFIGRASPHWQRLQELVKRTGVTWLPFINPNLFHRILSWICSLQYIGVFICASIMFTTENIVFSIEKDLLQRLFKHYPHPGSTKSIIHLFQLMNSGRFSKFDYGQEENLRRYNSSLPPVYDLSKVTAPTAIFYSPHDTLVNYKDAEWLVGQLNTVLAYSVPVENFAHLSFMWDPNIKSIIHRRVITFLLSL